MSSSMNNDDDDDDSTNKINQLYVKEETVVQHDDGINNNERSSSLLLLESELAFLVTHWLSNYQPPQQPQQPSQQQQGTITTDTNNTNTNNDRQQQQQQQQQAAALKRLRNATMEIASAFTELGTFGTTITNSSRPSFRFSSSDNLVLPSSESVASERRRRQFVTYNDMYRRWSSYVRPQQLESLVRAAATSTMAANQRMGTTNLLLAARDESSYQQQQQHRTCNGSSPDGSYNNNDDGSRRLSSGTNSTTTTMTNGQSSSTTTDATASSSSSSTTTTTEEDVVVPMVTSILQTPVLLGASSSSSSVPSSTTTTIQRGPITVNNNHNHYQEVRTLPLSIQSDGNRLGRDVSETIRTLLNLRLDYQDVDVQITSLQRQLNKQQHLQTQLLNDQRHLAMTTTTTTTTEQQQQQRNFVDNSPTTTTNGSSLQLLHLHPHQNMNDIGQQLLTSTNRLIPQHMQTLSKLRREQTVRLSQLRHATMQSQIVLRTVKSTMERYQDVSSFGVVGSYNSNNGIVGLVIPTRILPRRCGCFLNVMTRQFNGGGGGGGSTNNNGLVWPPRRIHGGAATTGTVAAETVKFVVMSRLTYVMTTNVHLHYPVFCLTFDKTGRYFVTGADDCLVKVFYIGAGQSKVPTEQQRQQQQRGGGVSFAPSSSFSYGTNECDAVLVCTLRGHAGVICDINVSSDNAFLATASDDGDCRVWGLRDGAPIAILRGHVDGANMVSWSSLVPYRLVTTGSDGLCRMWDIREAARNRYGAHVGRRQDYSLPSVSNGGVPTESSEATSRVAPSPGILATGNELLPPLPVRNNGSNQNGAAGSGGNGAGAAAVFNGESGGTANANANQPAQQDADNDNPQPGQFVRNDYLDEGVRLVAKLQHGAPTDANQSGAATRSRRKAVKVICIARCPRGGHFATGADDGICRLWSDEDCEVIAGQDAKIAQNPLLSGHRSADRRSVRVQQQLEGRLLAEFTGHLNAITDLQYSNAGDRIVTASQKDGVARIWSWTELHGDAGDIRIEKVKQILLQGKRSESINSSSGPSRRRATSNNASCDVAVWTADDSKIVTSQCYLVKEGSAEIVEGSQHVLVWDSRSGQCLLGIAAAHNDQVSVLVPHPSISSLLCSAGSDGVAKMWDLEKGECFLMHENKTLDIGPVSEINEQRKYSSYLDGSFSPDGLSLVLTDDNGRFTMFNIASNSSAESTALRRSSPSDQRIPSWMKEQYFASDYYELYYDTNGYCVETGSGQPPHMAPRSVRCSFLQVPWAEEVSDTFSRIVGPLPLPEPLCRRNRDEIRYRSFLSETDSSPENNRANLVSYFDPLRTPVVDGKSSSVVLYSSSQTESASQPSRGFGHATDSHGSNHRSRSQTTRRLSSNYRWSGYDDILAEEAARDEEEDADDDDYIAPRAVSSTVDEELSDDLLTSDSDDEGERILVTRRRASSSRSARNRRRRRERERTMSYEEQSRSRPTRVSARALSRSRNQLFEAESDSDSIMDEYLSTNNTPSGPHVQDYTDAGHFFRLPDSGRVIKRQWLRRTENKTSYNGLKNYAPQVGDSVVYIPRAHYETLEEFPTLDAPWKYFPSNTRWPVVRCCIRDIRYRFPYEQYYRSGNGARCLSVVAILTLEVTGIPSLSSDRTFPWPKASFVGLQTRGKVFEVSMFESDCPEFVIPESLFTWRLESLENASGRTRRQIELSVVAYFSTEEPNRLSNGQEDREMVAYRGTLKSTIPSTEHHSDEHLRNSGYGSIEVEWLQDSTRSILSPWEIALEDNAYETPEAPHLSPAEMRAIDEALSKVETREDVAEYFLYPVDETRYSDYRNRVELPMDFTFIRERLSSGYYSNVRSALSDARLIRDNCLKYNGTGTLSNLASDVYEAFEVEVRNRIDLEEFTEEAVSADLSAESNSSRAQMLTRRQSHESSTRPSSRLSAVDSGSSLERLPSPERRTRNAASSARTPRMSEPEVESRTSVRTRSGTNGAVSMAMDIEHDQLDEFDNVPSGGEDDSEGSRSDFTEEGPSRKSSGRSTTRNSKNESSRATAGMSSSDEWHEKQQSSSSEDESDASPPLGRRPTRSSKPESGSRQDERSVSLRRSNRAKVSRTRSVSSALAGDVFISPRRSSRSRSNKSLADLSHSELDEEESQDEELESGQSESEDEEKQEHTVTRRGALKRRSENTPDLAYAGTRGAKRRKQSPRPSTRSSRPKRNTRAAMSMADLSCSEADDESDSSPEEEAVLRNAKRRAAASKRTRGEASGYRSSKKGRSQPKQEDDEFPELKSWPEIDLKVVTKVCNAMLRHMAELDEDNLFAQPVVELVPDLEEVYLNAIETPMDFRTIAEDRIQYYTSIQQLQDDLILVFRNCATFNEKSSPHYAMAITLWEQMNDVFRNVCKEQGVLLPRRW